MKKFIIIIFISFCIFHNTGCYGGFTNEKILEIESTFKALNNNENFVAYGEGDKIYLLNKVIDLNEIDKTNSNKGILGVEKEYCYIYNIYNENLKYETLIIKRLYYANLVLEEIIKFEKINLDLQVWHAYENEKVCFSTKDKYCVLDLITKESVWSDNKDLSWITEKNFTFNITNNGKNDSVINITDIKSKEVKAVYLKRDLNKFEEGKYIQELDGKLKVASSKFFDMVESEDNCYIMLAIPLDNLTIEYLIVVLSYDFTLEKLNYYTSFRYNGYDLPTINLFSK